ncbi:MAG: histidine kinase [Bacteroidales bacterium]|nr:histidine kinase [Clostridium sp.]MCM1203464.1 histidine kinase [Bacteroidales bacterium]
MMEEQIRENYFLTVKTMLILAMEIYLAVVRRDLAGTSGGVLLLLALFLGSMVMKELFDLRVQWFFLLAAGLVAGLLVAGFGREYILLGMFILYEGISCLHAGFLWYFFPVLIACVPMELSVGIRLLVCLFLGVIYFQQDMVVGAYRRQVKENNVREEKMKKNIHQRERVWKEEMNRSILATENRILEERTDLSQTLHDRLGHNINGSIYQLEAVKVLLEQDSGTSREMIQAVIDHLRVGMEEIRAILRRERPEKYKLALLQLEKLCEECRQAGIDAVLLTEGSLETVPERYLEIALDNAVEAVTNALKYAECSRIEIKILVMNRIFRCSVTDNGIGCGEIIDGMGISGMRRRMREVKGILDFDTGTGFAVNMLFPLEKQDR